MRGGRALLRSASMVKLIKEVLGLLWKVIRQVLWERVKKALWRITFLGLLLAVVILAVALYLR